MSGIIRKKNPGNAWGTVEDTGNGGSQPGAAIVRGPFSFAFDTPGLANGVAFYTPTIDDVLLDAWIEVDTAFDGTTPLADIGTFVGQNTGFFIGNTVIFFAIDLSVVDTEHNGLGVFAGGTGPFKNAAFASDNGQERCGAPARFTAANPLKLVASQNGEKGGTPIDSTVGAARVYIITATPVAF